MLKEFAERIVEFDPAKKFYFEETKLQEYDSIALIVEKSVYAKCGAHKGMIGTILDSEKLQAAGSFTFPTKQAQTQLGFTSRKKI